MEQRQDAGLYVRFEKRAIYNKAKSEGEKTIDNDGKTVGEIKGEGRPIYDDVTYVHIEIPGDKDSILERPAMFCGSEHDCRATSIMHCDIHRFPRHHEAFAKGQAEQQSGTPLKEWPGIKRSEAEELVYFRVYTVESLAALTDSNAQRFFHLRDKARAFLKASEGMSAANEFRAENDALRGELAAQKAQFEAQQAQINQLLAMQAKASKPAKAEAK